MSTIKDADKIAVIADGHCVEYGTYDELMELKGEFYQMKRYSHSSTEQSADIKTGDFCF